MEVESRFFPILLKSKQLFGEAGFVLKVKAEIQKKD